MASEDSRAGARAHPITLGRWGRAVFRAPLKLYDWHLGWLLGTDSFGSPTRAGVSGADTEPSSR